MKLLYLHGWNSLVGGVKPTFLQSLGHEVIEPALDHDNFEMALATAQAAYDASLPDIVVGSSRGGAVAMNLQSGHAKLVLLCPAWKRWGSVKAVKPGTIILHSRGDGVIPVEESLELVRTSGLPDSALVEVGSDHRLAEPEPLRALARAVEGI
jgi:alpha-beta hydrolase superfamily lysophospholipase